MNILPRAKELLVLLEEKRPLISKNTSIQDIATFHNLSCDYLEELKQLLRVNRFSDEKEEIQFFKATKPKIPALYFYSRMMLDVLMTCPRHHKDELQEKLEKYALRMRKLIQRNNEFYYYHLSGRTEEDNRYYQRKQTASSYRDDSFSTGYDIITGKLAAIELIIRNICLLERKPATQENLSMLSWTASKTDLIELIYSLQYSKAINEGSVDIRSIAESFSSLFNIDLGDFYRTFQDIRIRKSGQANFLDKLKDRFLKKIAETDR